MGAFEVSEFLLPAWLLVLGDRTYQGSCGKLAVRWYGVNSLAALTFEMQVCSKPTRNAPQAGQTVATRDVKEVHTPNGRFGLPMRKQDIESCRRMLEAKKQELLSGRHKAEGITVERVSDSVEELTMEMERSMAVDALNRNAALLSQVTEALERIAAGRYGICIACEHAIALKRLAALPWGALCLECQQIAETAPSAQAITGMGARLHLTA